jgi:integrase
MRCLLGLLATTGLRVSEALRLHRADVDLDQGLLTVRETKFRKSRYVPLHATTAEALAEYVCVRNRCVRLAQDPTFFLFDNGRAINYQQARYAFGQIRSRLGWDRLPNGQRPRLYDLRHAFACKRLLAWYAEGVDAQWAISHLATYLGHRKVSDTYWYLTGIPDLLAVAAKRLEQAASRSTEEPS